MTFEHLAEQYDPRGRTSRCYLPMEGAKDGEPDEHGIQAYGRPYVEVLHAGSSNKPLQNALVKMNANQAAVRRLQALTPDKIIEEERKQDRLLFPKYVITGWEFIPDPNRDAIPYTKELAIEWASKMPDHIFDIVRNHAKSAFNFHGSSEEPNEAQVEEQAGNS